MQTCARALSLNAPPWQLIQTNFRIISVKPNNHQALALTLISVCLTAMQCRAHLDGQFTNITRIKILAIIVDGLFALQLHYQCCKLQGVEGAELQHLRLST
eukprot:2047447-Amphidinium_carterae.1